MADIKEVLNLPNVIGRAATPPGGGKVMGERPSRVDLLSSGIFGGEKMKFSPQSGDRARE